MILARLFPVLVILICIIWVPVTHAVPATDARMLVEVTANPDEKGQSLKELHTDVRHAAELALAQLWDRIIPRQARTGIPTDIHATRFIQRAQPTPDGISISFHRKRVLDFLETRKIPLIPRQPAWNLDIRIRNASGQNMSQSAALVSEFATQQAPLWGYALSQTADSLIMQWRWLDSQQVSLSVRGTSRLGEFQETRVLVPGDPLPQLQQWLLETLLRARDAHASGLAPEIPQTAVASASAAGVAGISSVDIYGNPLTSTDINTNLYGDPYTHPATAPLIVDDSILISIERQASLPEQVLFEDDLRHDPRVASVLPAMLSHAIRRYRLTLKDPQDDQWLSQWFTQHGLSLTRTPDNGWLAR